MCCRTRVERRSGVTADLFLAGRAATGIRQAAAAYLSSPHNSSLPPCTGAVPAAPFFFNGLWAVGCGPREGTNERVALCAFGLGERAPQIVDGK